MKSISVRIRCITHDNIWLEYNPIAVPRIMKTKFLLAVMVFVSNSISPHIFEQCLVRILDGYVELLKYVIKPYVKKIASGRPYQDSEPCHRLKKS